MSEVTVERSIYIERDIEDVFAFVSDPRNDIRWCPSIDELEQVEGDAPAVGARYRFQHNPGPHTLRADSEIIKFTPPRQFKLRARDEYHDMHIEYSLSSVNGGTEMTQVSRIEFLKGFQRYIAPVIGILIGKELEKQFRNLKQIMEQEGS